MMRIKLEVVPGGSEDSDWTRESRAAPVWRGKGEVDYVCGHCEGVLAEKMELGQIKNLVLQCPRCGRYNKFP
jgi:DNA-directed RNA polymerase subunit RPC12/RpoP